MKIYIISAVLMVLVVVMLIVAQAAVSSNVSTVGVDFSVLETRIKKLRKENAILNERLLTASSYTVIAEKMVKEGFVPVVNQLTFGQQSLAHR